jgi:hypothetical protein
MLVASIACCFAATLYRRSKFSTQYSALNTLQERWRRSQGTADGYEFKAANGAILSVWTTERKYVNKTGLHEPANYTPDPTRFFVLPPGKWVSSVDEVLEIWDKYD